MMRSAKAVLGIMLLFATVSTARAELTLREVRTASDNVIVAFFTSNIADVNESNIENTGLWTINGKPARALYKYAAQADECDHHIYLETGKLIEGNQYNLETPYGNRTFTFRARDVFCEAIKTNQAGYSALSKTRYANFAIWLGTGGSRTIEGALPEYTVIAESTDRVITTGELTEIGSDASSGDHVYRIDLSAVPEGGPYKIVVRGYGCSHPFGVGGEFMRMAAYITFRGQYYQRCGCPIENPPIRKDPCHTLIYDVDGPIGEANIDVAGNERTFLCYGGYHDAGDADRRAYHMSNSTINLLIYEAFPDLFHDGQFDIPGEFTEDFHIRSYANNIPDIIDEAEWGALAWEYLQNDDGSIHFGTETRGYPDPFAAPMDRDTKKYGTVIIDDRATCTGAGLFMHLARVLKPYKPERAAELQTRAEKAMTFGKDAMADPERLYYHIQRYLLTGDEADHQVVKELYTITGGMKDNIFATPGYSLNDKNFDNPGYIYSYIVEKNLPTDPEIVEFFKNAIRETADANIAELPKYAYPVGNDSSRGGWGHNVRQPMYACAPLLNWKLTGEQRYIDAASVLMDWKLGLNPIGISYVTGLGFHQVHNPHDRESSYTKAQGWGQKPGITVFGPGITNRARNPQVIPALEELPKERQYIDDMSIISFNEFTIFETLMYDGLYTVLANGGKWNGANPYGE